MASSTPPDSLSSLRGLHTAPQLTSDQRDRLSRELIPALHRCHWFTVGVMAADRASAVACLRRLEQRLGWQPLQEHCQPREDPSAERGAWDEPAGGPVFLKGNQRTGTFQLRQEPGLGEGLLITGHNPEDPGVEDTWGPLPLDLFS